MIKKGAIIVTFLLALFLVSSCSTKDQITGEVVVDVKASLLQINVQDELGEIIPEARIYVNNVLKGRTSRYGESKGSKLIILNGEDNKITVEKEGYFTSKPISISSTSLGGEQKVTITLEKERSSLNVEVENEHGKDIEKATVTLAPKKNFALENDLYTDIEGLAVFEKVDDGNYSIKVNFYGYEEFETDIEISYEIQKENILEVALVRLPHLDIEVVDNHGQLLEHAEITLYSKNDYNTPGSLPTHITLTNELGVVTYYDVSLGETYVVIIKKEGFEAQTIDKTPLKDDQFLHVGMNLVQEAIEEPIEE